MKSNNKNKLGLPLIFMLVHLIMFGCTNPPDNTISIGVVMPLTGVLSEPGNNIVEGIELALSKYNSSCSDTNYKIKLIIEDSKSNSRDGVSALNKLIYQDKVKIVVGDMSSDIFLAGAPIAEHNKVVMISPGASNPAVRNAGDYIFRNYLSDEFDGKIMAKYLFSRMGKKRACLIFVNGDYGIGVINAFEKEYHNLGGSVVYKDSFLPGTTDFKSMIIKIKKANPDIIYLVGNPAENGYFVKQIRLYRLNIPVTGNLAFENIDFLTVAQGTFDSVIYSTAAYDRESELPEVKEFVKDYMERYHKKPNMEAGLGYDVMNILIYCLQQTNYNPELVKDQLYKINGFIGVTGSTSFDEFGDVMKDIYVKKMTGDGTISLVESYRFTNVANK